MTARISAPNPEKRVASCATTQRPVFFTELQIVSTSSGTSERKSMISASTPSPAAAACATNTIVPYVMMVTSLPARTMSALPERHRVMPLVDLTLRMRGPWHGGLAGSPSKGPLYRRFGSKKITGSSSSIAVISNPLAS